MAEQQAIRAAARVPVDLSAVVSRAHELGVLGWVRRDGDGVTRIHAEGAPEAVEALAAFAGGEVERVKVEGHEQFAVRGVPAGAFVVFRTPGGFEFRLEVDGVMRSWAVPKGPSMDPAAKRFAVAAGEHPVSDEEERPERIVWDRGTYEQGGRVPWPEAIERGHAVFVLHGEKLEGGFALQRTPRGWLLVKRRDDAARPGSDVVAERPGSVVSGRALGPG